jgi:hypothetical protein
MILYGCTMREIPQPVKLEVSDYNISNFHAWNTDFCWKLADGVTRAFQIRVSVINHELQHSQQLLEKVFYMYVNVVSFRIFIWDFSNYSVKWQLKSSPQYFIYYSYLTTSKVPFLTSAETLNSRIYLHYPNGIKIWVNFYHQLKNESIWMNKSIDI